MKHRLILFFLITFSVSVMGQSAHFDSLVVKGINQIYNLKFNEAETTFHGIMADYPEHPAGRFFIAMIDWWKILLDLDNESYDDIFFAKLEDVIFQCDGILEEDPSNVDALFFKGGAIGFRGRLRAIRESWIKAADDGREAMPIVQRASKLDPSNIDVQLGFGIYNYYASVIPEKYPIIKPLMIFFPDGDKNKGIQELNFVAEKGKYARVESRYFLMTLYFQYEENYGMALQYAKQLIEEFPDNSLFQRYFGRINVRIGHYGKAEEVFNNVYKKSREGYTGYNNVALREASYYLGFFHKIAGNTDSAIVYFKECLDISRKIDKDEESGFFVNSVLYLGNMRDQKKERAEAIEYYNELLSIRNYNGSHDMAKKYLNQPYGQPQLAK